MVHIAINFTTKTEQKRNHRMYVRREYRYGNRIEIRKYHTCKFQGKGEKRLKRNKPTPEQVKKNNEKQAERKLFRLMANNFTADDWHVVLNYANETRPDAQGAKRIIQRFLRKMRAWYKKNGYEFKWIMTTEWANAKNIHHHIVMNGVEGLSRAIQRIWREVGGGGCHFTPLYEDQDFEGLAEYFVKETKKTFAEDDNPFKQRAQHSRNLKKPEERKRVLKSCEWAKDPSVSKKLQEEGYVLDKDSVTNGFDFFGFEFQEYILIRYQEAKR